VQRAGTWLRLLPTPSSTPRASGWPSKFWPVAITRSRAQPSLRRACSMRLAAKRARWRKPVADRSLVRPGQQAKGSRHRCAKRARRRPYASFHGTGGSAPESAAATRAPHSSSQAWVQSSPGPSSTLASSLDANSSRASGGSASAASNSFSGAIWETRSVGARPPHGHGHSRRGYRDAAGATKRGNPEATTSRFLLAIPLTRPGEGSREYTRPRRLRPF